MKKTVIAGIVTVALFVLIIILKTIDNKVPYNKTLKVKRIDCIKTDTPFLSPAPAVINGTYPMSSGDSEMLIYNYEDMKGRSVPMMSESRGVDIGTCDKKEFEKEIGQEVIVQKFVMINPIFYIIVYLLFSISIFVWFIISIMY